MGPRRRPTGPPSTDRGNRPHDRFPALPLAAAVVAALTAAGCGSSESSAPSVTSTAPPATSAVAGTQSAPSSPRGDPTSAAAALAGFFVAAEQVDVRLREASAAINAGIGTDVVRIGPQVRDAVRAADPQAAARAIPAGLDDELLGAVLLVHEDLVTRRAALARVEQYAEFSPLPRGGEQAQELIECLGHGADPAAHFATDLAAARALADRAPAPPTVAADSRQAAEVAVRVALIRTGHVGCNACGGVVNHIPAPLPPITWKHIVVGDGTEWDGRVGDHSFWATYRGAAGWEIGLDVC